MHSFTDANRAMLLAKAEEGFPVPVLDDAPVLPDRLQWAMKAFRDLRTCRPVGLAGPGLIPVTEMLSYFRLVGLPEYLWQEAKEYLFSAASAAVIDTAVSGTNAVAIAAIAAEIFREILLMLVHRIQDARDFVGDGVDKDTAHE